MSKMIDITGQRFGKLIVIQRAENSKDGKARWLCKCDCGKEKIIIGTHLRRGKILSCGCYGHEITSKMFLDDLTNKKFGKLTVIERIPGNTNGNVKWKCRCDCGTFINVEANALRSNHTKSCGCINSYGEEKIANILNINNISYIKQYSFSDCYEIQGFPLKFDFAIFDNNKFEYLIEYDGIQHFQSANVGWNNQEHLKNLQQRDKIKNEYCLKNNIPLIRIPYTKYNSLTIEDLLLQTSTYLNIKT